MMIKNETIKKRTYISLFPILILLLIVTIPFADLYAADDTGRKSDQEPEFLFENVGKDVPEELAAQVKLYWKYKGLRRFEPAYQIEAPHTKYQIPLETYNIYHVKARKLKGCRIVNMQKSGELAIVTTELLFDDKEKSLKISNKTQVLNERWIDLNGKWYHVYVNPFANIR